MRVYRTLLAALALSLAAGCGAAESPDQFITYRGMGSNHFERPRNLARHNHGGVKRQGNNLDIDGDRMSDLFVEAEDGTVFHTRSMRIVHGEDDANKRTWFKAGSEVLEHAKKGEYPSP